MVCSVDGVCVCWGGGGGGQLHWHYIEPATHTNYTLPPEGSKSSEINCKTICQVVAQLGS